ncbi:hypothetical protein ACVIGA_007206 [Bradyrhizobium sp. USDA 3240]
MCSTNWLTDGACAVGQISGSGRSYLLVIPGRPAGPSPESIEPQNKWWNGFRALASLDPE